MFAGRADLELALVTSVDDKIADVGDPIEGVGEHKHRISPVKECVEEQHPRTDDAEPPECYWHNDLALFFGGIPLDNKAAEKNDVSGPADDFP